jgi:hypothetical protein
MAGSGRQSADDPLFTEGDVRCCEVCPRPVVAISHARPYARQQARRLPAPLFLWLYQ